MRKWRRLHNSEAGIAIILIGTGYYFTKERFAGSQVFTGKFTIVEHRKYMLIGFAGIVGPVHPVLVISAVLNFHNDICTQRIGNTGFEHACKVWRFLPFTGRKKADENESGKEF